MAIKEEVATGRRGQVTIPTKVDAKRARVEMPAGVFCVRDSADDNEIDLPASAAEVNTMLYGGVAYQSTKAVNSNGIEYSADDIASVLKVGTLYLTTEDVVSPADGVYVRHTAKGGNTQLGAVRADADANATVYTVNTATNDSEYVMTLNGVEFKFTSDASATVEEIALGLVALIDAHASFSSTDNLDGTFDVTTTLNDGQVVSTSLDSRITAVDGATCALVAAARFEQTTGAAGTAKVTINLP